MVHTITPVVHGGDRRKWGMTVALHVLGAVVSASALGAVLGAAGAFLGAPWGVPGSLAIAALAGLYATRELAGLPIPVLELRRQVPEWWRAAFSPGAAAFLYGLGLGIGFLTHLRHGTLLLVAAAAAASGDPFIGMLLMSPFGLARALAVLVVWRADRRDAVARLTDRLEGLAVTWLPSGANGSILLAVAVAAVASSNGAVSGEPGSLAAVLLAVAFAWAAGAKLVRPRAWRDALGAYSLVRPIERVATFAVPAAEATVTLLILQGSTTAGGGLGLVLLGAFSIALLRARAVHGDRLPCGCFGGTKVRDYRLLLARNGFLALVAGLAILGGPPTLTRLALPGEQEILPALLALAGVALAGWTLRRALALLGANRG